MATPQVTPNPGQAMMNAPPQSQVQSPGGMSVQELAAKIKEQHPKYKDTPDQEVVQKLLVAHPEFGHLLSRQSPSPSPAPKETGMGKFMSGMVRHAPVIGGAAGALLGGAATLGMGGEGPGAVGGAALAAALLPSAARVGGAALGGAIGAGIKSKAETGKESGKEELKSGAEQGAWEFSGGMLGNALTKAAHLLGVDEAIMKFALKSGEDFDRGLNPAAAMNKWKLKALATKDLYQKTGEQIGVLSKRADNIMQSALPTSQTIRPYAVIKGVLDQYKTQAERTADPDIRGAMESMIESVQKEFAPKPSAHQIASSVLSGNGMPQQTAKVMNVVEANALKREWGESVNWAKKPAEDKMQAVFKAEMEARRDIYQAMNKSIADAMGKAGDSWKPVNHDIFNLMEAKSLIAKQAQAHSDYGKTLPMKALDSLRKPGPASMAAGAARGAERTAGVVGNNLPNIGRAAAVGLSPGAPTPFEQQPQQGASNPFLVNR